MLSSSGFERKSRDFR